MGSLLSRPNRVRFLVKDVSNGKTFPHTAPEPDKFTLDRLREEIRSKLDRKNKTFILRHKSKILPVDKEPNQSLVNALGISENGTSETLGLAVEYLDSESVSQANSWTLHIKTLTGRVIEVQTYNPQELCVYGLKLLIQEESGVKPEQIRLVMDNKELDDGKETPTLVKDVPGVINGCTIHLVLKSS